MPKLMDEFVASLHIPAFEVQSNRVWDWDLTFLLGTGPPHWAVRGASQVHGSVKDRQVGKTIYLCICWPLSYFPTCRPLQTKLLSLLVRIWLCWLGAPKVAKQHLHYIVFNGSLNTEVQLFHANKCGYIESLVLMYDEWSLDVKSWSEKGKGKVLHTL